MGQKIKKREYSFAELSACRELLADEMVGFVTAAATLEQTPPEERSEGEQKHYAYYYYGAKALRTIIGRIDWRRRIAQSRADKKLQGPET